VKNRWGGRLVTYYSKYNNGTLLGGGRKPIVNEKTDKIVEKESKEEGIDEVWGKRHPTNKKTGKRSSRWGKWEKKKLVWNAGFRRGGHQKAGT